MNRWEAVRMTTGSAAFVGRDREFGALQRALVSALDGQGGFALVGGEAGIGKTTIVQRLATEASRLDAVSLTGGCYDLEATPPFGPWQELLDALAHHPGLPPPPAALGDPLARRSLSGPDELSLIVWRYLAGIATATPCLLVLEDLHWADELSIGLLRQIVRRVAGHRIMIVATYRDAELEAGAPLYRLLPHLVRESRPLRLGLRPLGREAIASLIQRRYTLPPERAAALLDHVLVYAEGNPFFTEELLEGLEEEGLLSRDLEGWSLGSFDRFSMPLLLRRVIDTRLERVSEGSRELLQAASVFGVDVPVDIWQAVTEQDDAVLTRTLDEAIAAQVLRDGGTAQSLRFRHALIRRALYDALPLPQRRAWHRRVGLGLAQRSRPDVEAVAYHLSQANDPTAIDWLIRAGDRALSLPAPATAVDHYTRALTLAAEAGQEPIVAALHGRGRAHATLGAFAAARSDYDAVIALAREQGDQRTEWQATIDLGVLWSERDYAQVGASFREALALAGEIGDPAIQARSLARIGNWQLNTGNATKAVSDHLNALRIHEQLDDQEGIASTCSMLAMDYLILGDLPRSADFARRASARFRIQPGQRELPGALIPLLSSGGVCSFASEVPEITEAGGHRAAGEEAIALAAASVWRAEEAFARAAFATYLVVRGEYDAALRQAEEAYTIATEIGHRQWETLAEICIGEVHLDLYAFDLARRHLTRAFELATEIGSFIHLRLAGAPLARLLIGTGEPERAAALLGGLIGEITEAATSMERGCWLARAELSLTVGDATRALRFTDELIAVTPNATSERLAPHVALQRAASLVALDRAPDADRVLARLRADALLLGYRPLLWRACDLHATALRRLHRAAAAVEAERARDETIEDLARGIADDDARERFRQGAGIATTSGDTLPAGLSQREVEVLRLAARGMTNAQIGDELFISPRTVKGHLESIYGKLGVDSRTAAAAHAIEHGLL